MQGSVWRLFSFALFLALCDGDGHHHGAANRAPVCRAPLLPHTFQLRERFWSVLKTVDVMDGDKLLGYVYTSAFNLDGRSKWVQASDSEIIATSVEQIHNAPTMTFMPMLEPTLQVQDCRGRALGLVAYGNPDVTLLTLKAPGGALEATSSSRDGRKGLTVVTMRDTRGRVRARVQKLPGWMDQWEVTLVHVHEKERVHPSTSAGKRLKAAAAEMAALRKQASKLEKAGKRLGATAVEVVLVSLREKFKALEQEAQRQREQLGGDGKEEAEALASDPRILVLAVAAESPAITVGSGIQLAKAPVFVFGLLLVIGWGLCCCYLGKYYFVNSGGGGAAYATIEDKEQFPQPDRLGALFEMKNV